MKILIKCTYVIILFFSLSLFSCDSINNQKENEEFLLDELNLNLTSIQENLFTRMKIFEEHLINTERGELIEILKGDINDHSKIISLIGMDKKEYYELVQLIEYHDHISSRIKEIHGVSDQAFEPKFQIERKHNTFLANIEFGGKYEQYLDYIEQRKKNSCISNLQQSHLIHVPGFVMVNSDNTEPVDEIIDEDPSFWDSECGWMASACTIVAGGASTGCGILAPICFGAGAALCFCEYCSGDWVDENCF